VLTVVDLGNRLVEPTQVRLRLLDGSGRVLARLEGELRPGQPLRLVARARAERELPVVRAEATLETSLDNFGTTPIVTLELVNERSGDVAPAATCPLAYDPKGQSGPLLNCECDVVSDFTT
jgi:hypothetical protein